MLTQNIIKELTIRFNKNITMKYASIKTLRFNYIKQNDCKSVMTAYTSLAFWVAREFLGKEQIFGAAADVTLHKVKWFLR